LARAAEPRVVRGLVLDLSTLLLEEEAPRSEVKSGRSEPGRMLLRLPSSSASRSSREEEVSLNWVGVF
jgi:hypothetical protein